MMQIEVNHLVKEYKRKRDPGTLLKALGSMFRPDYEIFRAVDDINLGIEKGEAVGYVGPNGSGLQERSRSMALSLEKTG